MDDGYRLAVERELLRLLRLADTKPWTTVYRLAVERERSTLVLQAIRAHQSNAETELSRFLAEVGHVNDVCDMRLASNEENT